MDEILDKAQAIPFSSKKSVVERMYRPYKNVHPR